MKSFYLIQRGALKDVKRSQIAGIDSLVALDYMGAAEFEFGSLPKSLREVVNRLPNLQIHLIESIRDASGHRLALICTTEEKDEIEKFVRGQIHNPYAPSEPHLHERTDFKEAVEGIVRNGKVSYPTTNFWWDIDNHWMAVFGKENAESVLFAIQKVKEKKGW